MAKIGKEGLDALNNGQLDNAFGGLGGGGLLGLGSLPGAMLAPMAVNVTRAAISAAAAKRMGAIPKNNFGMGVRVSGQTEAERATSTAENAISSIVGNIGNLFGITTTGKVLYLGHNGYYDGRANLGQTTRPARGVTTSGFGPRNLLGMSFHNGLDIANTSGTPTRAAAAGRVQFAGWDNTGYGNYIQIKHPDGTITGYGHHRRLLVKAGDTVSSGKQIGEMGSTGYSTGPHLHFQTGRAGNWFDPKKLFPGLLNGGFTLNDGYAMLHKREAVVPEPLTDKFRQGLDAFANMGTNQYNVNVTVQGDGDADKIARVVKSTLRDMDENAGPSRRIGK
jgi:murein DD-endopeptidase MepM/ murein hydrolase activator NlpD